MFRIFIYCDDPSHAPKRVPVDAFLELPGGGWHEDPPKKKTGRTGHVGSGMHMLGDELAQDGWALDPDVTNESVRTRHEIVCERTAACRRRSVPVRPEHLFPVLDRWRALGTNELSLAVLAATMGEQTGRREPNS